MSKSAKVTSVWDSLIDNKECLRASSLIDADKVPTPSSSMNWALEGGIAPDKIYCFEGDSSGGKSFFTLACLQKMLDLRPNAVVFWYDAEFSWSNHWMKALIDKKDHHRIIIFKSNDIDKVYKHFHTKVLDILENHGGEVCGVVIDSLQALLGRDKDIQDINARTPGGHLAHAMGILLKNIIPGCRAYQIATFLISQVRVDMDPMAKYKGGPLKGIDIKAVSHHVDVRVFFSQLFSKDSKIFGNIKNMDDTVEQVGHTIRAKIKKSKVGRPSRVAEFTINYDIGIVKKEEELFKLSLNTKVFNRKGNTYYFGDQKLGDKKDTTALLKSDKDLFAEIARLAVEAKSTGAADPTEIALVSEDDEGDDGTVMGIQLEEDSEHL